MPLRAAQAMVTLCWAQCLVRLPLTQKLVTDQCSVSATREWSGTSQEERSGQTNVRFGGQPPYKLPVRFRPKQDLRKGRGIGKLSTIRTFQAQSAFAMPIRSLLNGLASATGISDHRPV